MTLLLLVKPTTTCERKWRLNTHTMGSWGKSWSVFYLWLFNQWLFIWDRLFILFGMNSTWLTGIFLCQFLSSFWVVFFFKSKLCKIIIIQWRRLSLHISLIYKKIYDLCVLIIQHFHWEIRYGTVHMKLKSTLQCQLVWALHSCWRFKEINF